MLNNREQTNAQTAAPQPPLTVKQRCRVWLLAVVAVTAIGLSVDQHSGWIATARAADEGGHASGGGSSDGGHGAGGGSSGGAHDAGGGSSGGGHDAGGGSTAGEHESGGCGGGGGGCSGGEDKGRHGLGGGFGKRARNRGFNIDNLTGHVSGEHGQSGEGRAARHGISGSHYFGAGWLGGSRHVPTGIGGEPQSGFGEPGYTGLGGGGRGFGYWGGRTNGDYGGGTEEPPTTVPDDQLAGTVSGAVSGTGGPVIRTSDAGQELSCERFASEDLAGGRGLKGKNLTRLKIAGRMIAPGYTSNAQGFAGFAERHLAYYQEEALKPRHDPVLMGTYLGLVAEKLVNLSLVEQVDHILCVAMPAQDTDTIVEIAEGQRKHLKAFVGGDIKR